MSLEDRLSGWTGPSSDTEQEKQERTERMIRAAIEAHTAFSGCSLKVYAKGSYANNTNVKSDSDVDIAVQCAEVFCHEGESPTSLGSYPGNWTPTKLRSELEMALKKKFPGQVDSSGSTAFRIHSGSARVDADVVPCFNYRYYLSSTSFREGAKIFKKDGSALVNYPTQQLEKGRQKNDDTKRCYKRAVRIMKRVENAMVTAKEHRAVPSFFIECLVYNCPKHILLEPTWTETIRGAIVHIWNGLEGPEPTKASERWREVNECKWLFGSDQPWNRADGRDFAKAAWNYLGFKS